MFSAIKFKESKRVSGKRKTLIFDRKLSTLLLVIQKNIKKRELFESKFKTDMLLINECECIMKMKKSIDVIIKI